MVSARLEGGKKRGTGGGGATEGGGDSQSTLSEYKRGIVEI